MSETLEVVRGVIEDVVGPEWAVDRPITAVAAEGHGLRLGPLALTDPATRVDGKMKLVVDGTVRDRVAAYVEATAVSPDAPIYGLRLRLEVATSASRRRTWIARRRQRPAMLPRRIWPFAPPRRSSACCSSRRLPTPPTPLWRRLRAIASALAPAATSAS